MRKKVFFSKEDKRCNSIHNALNATRWNGVKNRPKKINSNQPKLAGKTYNPSNQDQANPNIPSNSHSRSWDQNNSIDKIIKKIIKPI